jgi:hypothetical protein
MLEKTVFFETSLSLSDDVGVAGIRAGEPLRRQFAPEESNRAIQAFAREFVSFKNAKNSITRLLRRL